ncbi:3-hydroxyisobutyrate dehydrogenase [Oceanospirillum linum]|uniref:3-hydroxyisobutyrate dehydrogenase n=1 Tax=Oceanospirillum linum TaxID=966 RepID=A0A1T1HCB5_OCELI|nr:3-hydroxyisobutyrate dehydrogenase [Oceanospirillum linum]OOV87518.1 3-hydroxyisobutyrate dehydrogenase [Oceanospirillum linum]SEF90520.1 3-hydroxyisobutyrate dehydrogenase [Oleiphilus messinensis]SMP13402.1 3-hydroxyisobutyrate dehydrogenase [Oceanospirillum linum]
MAKIAFIGLGNMGGPMAVNLVKAGHDVTVFDLVPAAVQAAVAEGAQSADSAEAAATSKDFVISMLPAQQHVEGLYIDQAGLLDIVDKNTVIIDSSTIAAESAQRVAAEADKRGIKMVDAPVSGGVGGAKAGTLSFIVGGSAEAFEQVKPILEAMGKNIFHAGDSGAGQVAKVCNNMLLAILMAGTTEAIGMGVKNGLDPAVLSDIMSKSSGNNWALQVYNPYPGVMDTAPASNDYQGGFMVDLMAKDLGLAFDSAVKSRCSIPMGSMARNLFAMHAANGNGSLDFSSIQKMFADLD